MHVLCGEKTEGSGIENGQEVVCTCCLCFAQTKYTSVDMQKFFSTRCRVFKEAVHCCS